MSDMSWLDLSFPGVSQAASEASYTVAHFPRRIDKIRIMRIPFYGWKGAWKEGEPGHYWIEIDHGNPSIRESYGWYPAEDIAHGTPTRMATSFLALPASEGCINGDSPDRQAKQLEYPTAHIAGRGIGNEPFPWDPHQVTGGANSIRHPYVMDERPEEEIFHAIRDYAAGYKKTSDGKWSFKFDDPSENNCHTFVWQTLFHCQLIDADILDSSVDPHFASIAQGGVHSGPVDQIIGYVKRPDFVDYLKSKAKVIEGILKRYGQTQ